MKSLADELSKHIRILTAYVFVIILNIKLISKEMFFLGNGGLLCIEKIIM